MSWWRKLIFGQYILLLQKQVREAKSKARGWENQCSNYINRCHQLERIVLEVKEALGQSQAEVQMAEYNLKQVCAVNDALNAKIKEMRK